MIRALRAAACAVALSGWAVAQEPAFPSFDAPSEAELLLDLDAPRGGWAPGGSSTPENQALSAGQEWAEAIGQRLAGKLHAEVRAPGPLAPPELVHDPEFAISAVRGAEVTVAPPQGEPFTVRARELDDELSAEEVAIYEAAFDFAQSGPYVIEVRGRHLVAVAGPAVTDPKQAAALLAQAWAATGVQDLPQPTYARAQVGSYDVVEDYIGHDLAWINRFETVSDTVGETARKGDLRRMLYSSSGRLPELRAYAAGFGLGRAPSGVTPALGAASSGNGEQAPPRRGVVDELPTGTRRRQ